jgi:hypothetical protein
LKIRRTADPTSNPDARNQNEKKSHVRYSIQ